MPHPLHPKAKGAALSMLEKYELKKLAVKEQKLKEAHDKEYDLWCRERIQVRTPDCVVISASAHV